MRPKQDNAPRPVLELFDAGVHLLRADPIRLLAPYYIGACPFVLGLLFFCADMSHDAFASQRLGAGAWGLTLLFIWMKVWQALFCAGIWSKLGAGNTERWSLRELARLTLGQIIIQPLGLFLIPLSALVMLPIFFVYPYYQCATALAGQPGLSAAQLRRRALKQVGIWQGQWVMLILVLQLIGLVVLINVYCILFALPQALKLFTGIESQMTMIGGALLLNSTFLITGLAVAYLLLDPVIKALCVIRCFQGEALATGADLTTGLLRQRAVRLAAALLLAMGLLWAAPGRTHAQSTPEALQAAQPETATLDARIDEVLKRRAYSWRMPRTPVEEAAQTQAGPIATFMDSSLKSLEKALKSMGKWTRNKLEDFVDWLFRNRKPTSRKDFSTEKPTGAFDAGLFTRVLIVMVSIAAGILLIMAALVLLRRRREIELEAPGVALVPDIEDESVGAEQLPVDGWMQLFNDLIARGDLRLAMRALYLAGLARLAEGKLITLQRAKSNRDYARELARRGHSLPTLRTAFEQNVGLFDAAWYGMHPVDQNTLTQFRENHERLRRDGNHA